MPAFDRYSDKQPVDPNKNPYEARAYALMKLGRQLTPEEEEIINLYENWKPTGGFPIGGPIGPMPTGGALHMREGEAPMEEEDY